MSAEKYCVFKRRWALLYQAAVTEADDQRRLHLIAQAKSAIFERRQALPETNPEALEERQALEDAGYILSALRRAAEFNLRSDLSWRNDSKTGTE